VRWLRGFGEDRGELCMISLAIYLGRIIKDVGGGVPLVALNSFA